MARARTKQKSAAKPARRKARKTSRRRAPAARDSGATLAAFAHDIRTALTGILALGELLASSNIGERERRWAASIKVSAEHLAALTTLVIDAAKSEAGELTLQREPFRPRQVIDALADSLAARAQAKGLDTEVTVTGDLPEMVVGDAVRLRAVLENLIDNAVKFTERGTVRLGVAAHRAPRAHVKLVFTVADSGIGLTRAEIARLFRPFAQASPDIARRFGGAGLGLAVVKRLARLMGGELTVNSTPGRGSRFHFSAVLPVAPVGTMQSTPAGQHAAPARRLAVLCVEDNAYGRVILNTILGELGHRADFAGSGEEAVAAIKHGYDVVLMDMTLPGIDGLEATRRIRGLGGDAGSTPVIGISGRTEAGDEAAARAAGMDAYLRKPVSPSALSKALAAVVETSS